MTRLEAIPTQEALARCAEAIEAVDEWLGQATTQQYALDAMWRARRALEAAGVKVVVRGESNTHWRGSVFRALERCGLGWTGSEDELRFRLAGQPAWARPAGPALREWIEASWRFVDLARSLRLEYPGNYYWLDEALARILPSRTEGARPAICSGCGRPTEKEHRNADPA